MATLIAILIALYSSSTDHQIRVVSFPESEVQLIWTLSEKPDTLKFYPNGTTNKGLEWAIIEGNLEFIF